MMRRLFGAMSQQLFLMLMVGIIVSAVVSIALSARQHQRELAEVQATRTAERVGELVAVVESMSPAARRDTPPHQLGVRGVAGISWQRDERGQVDATLTEGLRAQLGDRGEVTSRSLEPDVCDHRRPPPGEGPPDRPPPPPRPEFKAPSCQRISLTLADGSPISFDLMIRSPLLRPPLSPPWGSLAFFAACVGGLAWVVSRMATRPISQLAIAARELGENIDRPPLDESRGPLEVRRAAAAFNAMQSRIRNHVQERTQMLAAISHDLQTPLTRLRLRLEKVTDEPLRAKLIEDMHAMQDIVREGLDLARSIDGSDVHERVDIDSLIGSLCADNAEAGHPVVANVSTGAAVLASPTALRRCLGNLVDNALKYGGRAEIAAQRSGQQLQISVRDAGPGIPESELEKVFDPFYRLEESRSRDTGGTGLGLTIARNIATRLGGTLSLRNHPQGGLEAVLSLPLAG